MLDRKLIILCFNKYIKKDSSLRPTFSFFEYKFKRIDFFKTQLKFSTIIEGGKVINKPEYIFEFPCSAISFSLIFLIYLLLDQNSLAGSELIRISTFVLFFYIYNLHVYTFTVTRYIYI